MGPRWHIDLGPVGPMAEMTGGSAELPGPYMGAQSGQGRSEMETTRGSAEMQGSEQATAQVERLGAGCLAPPCPLPDRSPAVAAGPRFRPETFLYPQTHVHEGEPSVLSPDGCAHAYGWRPPRPPHGNSTRMPEPFAACGFCGSIHPSELAEAIRFGARLELASAGKVYIHDAPNRYAGLEQITSCTFRNGKLMPSPPSRAPERTWAKFILVHLDDATVADRATIEEALGFRYLRVPGRGCYFQLPPGASA